MDDFCIFSNERLWLKKFKNQVTSFLQEELMLGIKESATLINSGLHGLPFLGVRIFPAMIRHRKENFKRSYDKLKKNQWLYENESISYEKYCSSMQSLTAHLNYYGNNLLRCELFNKGIKSGSNRVKRGGSFNNNADNLQVGNVNNNNPNNENNNLGFRFASTGAFMSFGLFTDNPAV
jgi:hypothetical protein